MSNWVLETRNVVKDFGGTRALDQVSFAVLPGEVHALVGENGAGKSTLLNILCGALQPDVGSTLMDGRQISLESPHRARQSGIAVVYQHFNLVPELTVAENIFLGHIPQTRLGLVDWKRLFLEAQELVQRLDFDLEVGKRVSELTSAGRQITEIARALSASARVLILDEPSAVLGRGELEKLFKTIRRLRNEGRTIIYTSHRLEEIFQIADRVTVLKDGKHAGTYDLDGQVDRSFLIGKMVGREWSDQFPETPRALGRELLRVRDLTKKGSFEEVSFTLRSGQIIGLAGLGGSGRTELCKAIFGATSFDSGRVYVDGKLATIRSPRDALAHGIAYLSEDRQHEGLVMCLSVADNVTLPILRRFAPRGVLRIGPQRRFVGEMTGRMNLRARGLNQVVKRLSGGNQQKVALAKWLGTQAKIFLLDEPTVGIDIGAKNEIYHLIAELARDGAAVLMVSSEIPEILSLSSDIIVMSKGRITGHLSPEETSDNEVLHYATQ